jgi:hypothetical protein
MVKHASIFVFLDTPSLVLRKVQGEDGGGGWETNRDAVARVYLYAEAGYDVLEFVYGNLAGELQTVPIEAERKGVALMSGFSSGYDGVCG